MKQMRRAAFLLLIAVLICTLTAPALAGNMFLNIGTFTNHENASFVNNGTFENNGAVINSGSFNNNKVFCGTGSLHIGSKGRYENGENASFLLDSVTADVGATATGISVNSAAYQVTVIKEGGWPYYKLSTPASMADQTFSIEIYGTSEASFRTGGFSPGILMPFGEVDAGTYTLARIWKGTAFDSASLVAENIKLDKPVTVKMDEGNNFPLSNLPTVTRMRGTDSNGNSYWEYALQFSEQTFSGYTYCLVWEKNDKKNYMNLGESNRGTWPGTDAYMFKQVTLRAAKVTDAETGLTLELSKESGTISVVDSTTTSGTSGILYATSISSSNEGTTVTGQINGGESQTYTLASGVTLPETSIIQYKPYCVWYSSNTITAIGSSDEQPVTKTAYKYESDTHTLKTRADGAESYQISESATFYMIKNHNVESIETLNITQDSTVYLVLNDTNVTAVYYEVSETHPHP